MEMKEWFEKCRSNPLTGLDSSDISLHREHFGKNELIAEKKESKWEMFMAEMKDPLVIILLVCTLISGLMGEIIDAGIMVAVVLINASIGMSQKIKAEKSLASLKKMNLPVCECLRNGKWLTISTKELVVGDIVALKTGMFIPADVIIFDDVSLKVDESCLTGESVAVDKTEGDQAYMSTSITYGRAHGLVTAVGMNTEMGKIASVLQEKDDIKTPLQERLADLSEKLGILALIVCLMMFMVGVMQGRDFFEMLLLAISLAVAAIPEGLVAVVSIVLALGTSRMAKRNAVIRHLHAIETLGCVSYICSDKTGTLTQNEMHVMDTFSFQDEGRLSRGMILCNNAHDVDGVLVGEPTEKALMQYFLKYEDLSLLQERYPRMSEIPFDSQKKSMQVVVIEDDHYTAYCKGALEAILPLCSRLVRNGQVQLLEENDRTDIQIAYRKMTASALRVLALAYQPLSLADGEVKEMIFVGLVGMMDPCRPEAAKAIQRCRNAGVQVTMITGDAKDTAFAIAKELNLTHNPDQVMTSDELSGMDDRELKRKIESVRVFARTRPEDKVRIVEALQANGHIVAMSGDGVNDAPALKKAHVGVAMGLGGTDVAKDASDVILTDDHFETIVDAVEQGRQIYVNIRQTIWYLLSCNLGEIFTLFVGMLLLSKESSLLSPVMILWVNLVTDAFPALCLGVMQSDDHLMAQPPRKPSESLFSHGGFVFMITNGALIGLLSLVAYRFGLETSGAHASTMAFMVLSMSQLTHTFNFISTEHALMQVNFRPYRLLLVTVGLLLAMQIACVHVYPLSWLLKTAPLDLTQWALVAGLSVLPVIYNEIVKWLTR